LLALRKTMQELLLNFVITLTLNSRLCNAEVSQTL
jgi:hypothetical protein